MIDMKEEIVKRAMSKERREEENRIIQLKKDMVMQEMRGKYARLYELVRYSEKKGVEKMMRFFAGVEERMKNDTIVLQKPLECYRRWEEHAMREVDSYEKGINLEEQIMFLGYEADEENEDVLEEGRRILKELEQTIQGLH